MRVLHVVSGLSPRFGGSTTAIRGLVQALARSGIGVLLLTTEVPDEDPSIDRIDGVPTEILRLWPPKRLYYSPMMRRRLVAVIPQVDVVHVHDIWNYFETLAIRIAQKYGVPSILCPHGELNPWALNRGKLKKRLYLALFGQRMLNGATAFHALSQVEAEDIRTSGFKKPVIVIPNGVDVCEFERLPDPKEFRSRYPELQGNLCLLFMGRIHPHKGLYLLARAFGEVARKRNDVRLVIVGPDEGRFEKRMVDLLRAEGVLEKTLFTGILLGREKLAALANADIFVLSSYSEGLPMAAIEAMACGVPVILTENCGLSEVASKKAGIIVRTNHSEIAEAILKLAENPKLRKTMGSNGRRLILDKFTWDKVAEQMVSVYHRVNN